MMILPNNFLDDDDDIEIIDEVKPLPTSNVTTPNTSLNSSNQENCPCSDTQSDTSPQGKVSADGEHCKTSNDGNVSNDC